MEERLNVFYTKRAVGSRCLAVRIISSKEIVRVLLSFLINTKGEDEESETARKKERAISLHKCPDEGKHNFPMFSFILVVLGRGSAL